MNQSNSGHPDAFSQTLERTPRAQQHSQHRLSQQLQSQQQQHVPTTIPSRGQSINRLSQMFENEKPTSQPTKPMKPAKPKLPTKPPSLRSQQPSSSMMENADDKIYTTVKADDSAVDQTSLAFQDIRARFQQPGTGENKTSLRSDSTYGRLSNLDKQPKPGLQDASNQSSTQRQRDPPALRPTFRRHDSVRTESGERRALNSPANTSSPSPTEHAGTTRPSLLPRTGPMLSTPLASPSNSSREMASADSLGVHPRLLIPKRLSQNTLKSHLQPPPPAPPANSPNTVPPPSTGLSSLHTISRSGTGNSAVSAVSTSSLSSSSSSPATASPSKRAWNNYGNTITNWFSNGSSAHTDHQHQQQQSLKDSIVMVSNTSSTSSTSSGNNVMDNSTTFTKPSSSSGPSLIHSTSFESLSSSAAPLSSSVSVSTSTSTTTSPPSMIPPQSTGTKQDKRAKVMDELWKTEKIYQEDMLVLKEIYYEPSLSSPDSGFSPSDVKHVFSNLLAIVDFEAVFVDLLSNAIQIDDGFSQGTVGMVFKDMMQQIDQVYCDYCKRHTDAVIRLQELESIPKAQQFLQSCAEQLPGRTQSWDIGSLLIKPVQRVLKYPLLLKELLTTTPTDHPDYENLCIANNEIQNVADHINEIKRRKDIVEKIVGDKKKTDINVVHGINKKLTRKAHRIRQVTGLAAEATQDTLFDALHQKFEDQQEIVRQLARDIQAWVRQVKDNFDNLMEFATSLEEVYSAFGGVRVRSMNQIKEFTKMAATFRMIMSRELDTMIHGYIYSRIESFLLVYENPSQVISKRAQKLLDYDRVRGIKARGDVPDKALQESADVYVSINAQLVEELPLLFDLTRQYFDIIVEDLAMVQKRYYEQTYREWNKLMQHLRQDVNTTGNQNTMDTIIKRYHEEMDIHVRPLIEDIMPLNKERWKMVLGVLPLTPLADDLTGNSNRPKGPDDYFDRTLSVQSFNDDDTRSTTSSRKYGSPVWKDHRGAGNGLTDMGRTPTDDESSKATTPQQQDDHCSKTQGSSVASYNNSNLAEPAFECLVIHDYLEPSQEALCVHKGDVIQVWVEDEDEDGLQGAWLYAGISVGHAEHFGWVPSQYCQRL
ncbi:unnamed protein product [Absidia cylindrospora]